MEQVSRSIDEPRERIVAALSYLEEAGDLVVRASNFRQCYRALEVPSDLAVLCETLSARFARREEHDIARIRSMVLWAEHDG